ncbi:MAG: GTP-binding protein [Candidatus Lokiarchaeota archaeon]|nr:GTP-binding protein [Candidatus Lokiarchaeota archaeon]
MFVLIFKNHFHHSLLEMEQIKTIKIIVAGDGAVGKTSLLDRYINDIFDDNSLMTKGIGFFSKTIKIDHKGNEYNVIFWDFGGQEQFRFMLPNFISGAVGAMLLFDLSRFASSMGIEGWMNLLMERGDFPLLLVGTKSDLEDANHINLDKFANHIVESNERCFGYMKTSAKSNYNIKETFYSLLDHLVKRDEKTNSKQDSIEKFVA